MSIPHPNSDETDKTDKTNKTEKSPITSSPLDPDAFSDQVLEEEPDEHTDKRKAIRLPKNEPSELPPDTPSENKESADQLPSEQTTSADVAQPQPSIDVPISLDADNDDGEDEDKDEDATDAEDEVEDEDNEDEDGDEDGDDTENEVEDGNDEDDENEDGDGDDAEDEVEDGDDEDDENEDGDSDDAEDEVEDGDDEDDENEDEDEDEDGDEAKNEIEDVNDTEDEDGDEDADDAGDDFIEQVTPEAINEDASNEEVVGEHTQILQGEASDGVVESAQILQDDASSEITVHISPEQARLMYAAQKQQELPEEVGAAQRAAIGDTGKGKGANGNYQPTVPLAKLVEGAGTPDVSRRPTQPLTDALERSLIGQQTTRPLQRPVPATPSQMFRPLSTQVRASTKAARTSIVQEELRARRHKRLLLRHLSRKHMRLDRDENARSSSRFWATILTLTTVALFLLLGLTGGGTYLAYRFYADTQTQYAEQILNLRNLMPLDNLKMYDRNNILIGQDTIGGLKTEVPLSSISPWLTKATVATEDKDFWNNSGIDLTRIVQSALDDLRNNQVVEGGSTITQQLIKNLILPKIRTCSVSWRRSRLYQISITTIASQTFWRCILIAITMVRPHMDQRLLLQSTLGWMIKMARRLPHDWIWPRPLCSLVSPTHQPPLTH